MFSRQKSLDQSKNFKSDKMKYKAQRIKLGFSIITFLVLVGDLILFYTTYLLGFLMGIQ